MSESIRFFDESLLHPGITTLEEDKIRAFCQPCLRLDPTTNKCTVFVGEEANWQPWSVLENRCNAASVRLKPDSHFNLTIEPPPHILASEGLSIETGFRIREILIPRSELLVPVPQSE